MADINNLGNIIAVTGHYGSGKTNLAVNLAVDFAKEGERVTIIDLDIVNPYFRTADFSELFGLLGIKLVAPQFANTNLDIPSLGFDMAAVINGCDRLIIDVGGDDTGAVALGQYATVLGNFGCELYYVVNRYRYLTRTPGEAVELLRDIEQVSRIRAKGIVNCSNLGSQTTADDVKVTADYALKCASEAGVPLALTAAERSLGVEGAYPVDVYVRPFWEE
ncbi:MAG TPA: cobalamin biosynthesis protein CobQ [Ruminococcaceae bacterium]|nr:cobalamin biosynthesis protein CobQ [Oscillospiraceae bacterium]HCK49894.1 cobalamin biosynthesis protein CobQ [Oscillospiraceae bacterium]